MGKFFRKQWLAFFQLLRNLCRWVLSEDFECFLLQFLCHLIKNISYVIDLLSTRGVTIETGFWVKIRDRWAKKFI